MTKKDYEKMAQIFKSARARGSEPYTIDCLIKELSDVFKSDNPRFNFDKFYEATLLNAEWEKVKATPIDKIV